MNAIRRAVNSARLLESHDTYEGSAQMTSLYIKKYSKNQIGWSVGNSLANSKFTLFFPTLWGKHARALLSCVRRQRFKYVEMKRERERKLGKGHRLLRDMFLFGKWHLPASWDLRASTWHVRVETSFSLFSNFSIVSGEKKKKQQKVSRLENTMITISVLMQAFGLM